ncbi:MAG: AI-2E family transporter [candidate division Zixibacteria bacterium]|nr:AI-2E family transporter [candidate division Zixibacteria bacterium]
MKREYILISLFFLITAIFFYLFYEIMVPFFAPICWAAVFVIIFFPVYEKVLRKVRTKGVASLVLCVFIIILIIGPLTYLFVALVNEAAAAVAKVNAMHRSGELDNILTFNLPWVDAMKEQLSQYYDISNINLDQIIKDSIDKVGEVIFSQTSWIVTNGTKMVFYFCLMIFTMYYFFKDGEKIIHKIKRLMPLPEQQVDKAFAQLRDVIQATMYGGLVVALIQGLLGGLLFVIMGIPSPVFWGAIMAFLAIIPFVGAFLVYVPAGIILFFSGSYIKGILVIAIGTLVISQSDNIIRPYLISGKTTLHPLMLFFTILGGIYLFGLLGLIVGPLIAAVFITLLNTFEVKLHPEDQPLAADSSDDA